MLYVNKMHHMFLPSTLDPSDSNSTAADKKSKKPSTPTSESEFPKYALPYFPKRSGRGISVSFPLLQAEPQLRPGLFIACEQKENIVLTPDSLIKSPKSLLCNICRVLYVDNMQAQKAHMGSYLEQ